VSGILKLLYFQLRGTNIAWAEFHCVEIMSLNSVEYKRIGLLAASIIINYNSNIVLLTTNLFLKLLNVFFDLEDFRMPPTDPPKVGYDEIEKKLRIIDKELDLILEKIF
jgi:hypothetical protein